VIFPELFLIGYDLDQLVDPTLWLAEHDSRLDPLREQAGRHDIWLCVGAAVVMATGQRWLAVVVIGPDGTEWVHGKQFPHGAEHDRFDAAPAASRDVHIDGWSIALAVCYDVAVPVHAATAAARGADVYAASALYVEGEERRVDIHFASRAMDHRMFTVLANHAGPTSIGRSIGGSGSWSPTGNRGHCAGSGNEVVLVTLDRAHLAPYR
jgi:predicted amidohydrolase